MADFRKWILVLAVLAVVAAPASAQLACTARATPSQVRGEGITELVGDTILTCTNDVAREVSIEAIIGLTNITNRITASATRTVEAYVIIDGDVATARRGRLNTDNSVLWESLVIPAVTAPATQITIRLTNIRINASALGVGVGGAVTQVTETVLVSGTNVLDVPNNVLNVAAVRRGLNFAVLNAANDNTFLGSFQACLGLNTGAVASTRSGSPNFRVRFSEGFSSAFRIDPEVLTFTSIDEHNPSINPDGGTVTDTITNPTQLRAVFSNVPTGVVIFAAVNSTGTDLVDVTAEYASGGGDEVTISGVAYRPVTLTGGAGQITWSVTDGVDPALLERATFNVIVHFPANVNVPVQAGPTVAARAGGTFAPVSTTVTASTTAAIPRFIDTSTPQDIFTLSACVTNLLFPYVTNQAGFDTGVAIVNTSLDNSTGASGTPANQPFNTTTQSGTCTVYYFGAMGSGGQLPAPQTTATIAAGQMVTFALSAGGVSGATTSAASFQGYLIARCNFQFAHGLAFITDVGVNRVAHGYLALVIPDRGGSRVADPMTTAGAGTGEQLTN